ncbi:MAG TPA: TolC family outer membrane protein [Caulobacteraceae bacterium]|nr:TolC family outer membrane protein [Caulobacteraceae bacterium]
MPDFRHAALAAASCSLALGLGAGAAAATLADAVTLAYETNPTLQAARANQRAIDEEYPQAMAGLGPTVGLGATVTHAENQVSTFGQQGTFNTSQAGLQITQPLYTGGRVASAVDAATADILAGREALRQTEIQVLESVVQAYVNVRQGQEQLAIAQDNVNVLRHQLDETNARFQVGEVTRTDVAQSQARLALGRAQLASVQSSLAISRSAYDEVVGENPDDLAPEPPLAALLPASVDAAFDAAERNSPQLLQANYAEEAAAARLAQAKAQRRPTISVQGSVGYSGGVTPFGISAGNPFADYTRALQVQATAQIPLFAGGLTFSEIRQAAERDNVARIGIETARRQVLQAVSQAWNQLLGARASLAADEEQVRADTIAYEGTRQEEQVGLRTTLDVLNAEQELENSELSLVGARHDEYVAAAAVLAAMGSLDARNLIPTAPRYDAARNFRKRRDGVWWTPWEPALEAVDHLGAPSIARAPAPTPPGQVVKP